MFMTEILKDHDSFWLSKSGFIFDKTLYTDFHVLWVANKNWL